MDIQGKAAIVTGGGSGLGEATARELAAKGAKVAVLDVNLDNAKAVAADIGGVAFQADVTDTDSVTKAIELAEEAHGVARIIANIAGIGGARRIYNRKTGEPAPLDEFERIIRISLIGSYNVTRLAVARLAQAEPLEDNERGVVIFTSSAAAMDGQVGQQAYSAAKGGLSSMTLPMARDLAQYGIRVMSIAPGLFNTPLMQTLPENIQQSLAESIPFPNRLGKPEEFAQLISHIAENTHLNGEVIRLDGAIRLAPR
ncbi:MAG: SDR family NAD(P)-dependent oxidoreductase [Endozoicomonas sp.]